MRDFSQGRFESLSDQYQGWYTKNDGGSSLIPVRNGKARGNLFGVMIKDVALSSFKYSALLDETLPLQSPLSWLGQSLPHRVVLRPLEFSRLV